MLRRCTIIAIGYTFFFRLCFSHISLSSGVSASIRDIFCLSVVCLLDCVLLHTALLFFSLSPHLLLLRDFAAFLALRLLRSNFLLGFSVLYRLPLRFFHLRVPVVFPCWYVHSFQLPLLLFMGLFLLFSFLCFSLASAISSFVLFFLPSLVKLFASLPFFLY